MSKEERNSSRTILEHMRENTPAFPLVVGDAYHFGMSLRDWFAGQALLGSIASDSDSVWNTENHAVYAYRIADAMMEARK